MTLVWHYARNLAKCEGMVRRLNTDPYMLPLPNAGGSMKENRDVISLESEELVRVHHKGLAVAIWSDKNGNLEVETRSTMVIESGHLGVFADEDSVEPNASGTVRLLVH